jgi:hypothetical protein
LGGRQTHCTWSPPAKPLAFEHKLHSGLKLTHDFLAQGLWDLSPQLWHAGSAAEILHHIPRDQAG